MVHGYFIWFNPMVIVNGIQIYVRYIINVSAIDFYCYTLVAEKHR